MSGSMGVVADADPPGAGAALASSDALRSPDMRMRCGLFPLGNSITWGT